MSYQQANQRTRYPKTLDWVGMARGLRPGKYRYMKKRGDYQQRQSATRFNAGFWRTEDFERLRGMVLSIPVIRESLPLKIGIHDDIYKLIRDEWLNNCQLYPTKAIKSMIQVILLKHVVNRRSYISNILSLKSKYRVDINGNPAKAIKKQHKLHALERLNEKGWIRPNSYMLIKRKLNSMPDDDGQEQGDGADFNSRHNHM